MKKFGYRYERRSGHGKMLVRDEPNASILQEAVEGYASCGQALPGAAALLPQGLPNGEIRNQRTYDLLSRVVYAGYVEAPNWGVGLRKGHHEGLISFETLRDDPEPAEGHREGSCA